MKGPPLAIEDEGSSPWGDILAADTGQLTL